MKKLPLLAFIMFHTFLMAQEKDIRYPLSRLAIKWSPLHTLDFFTTMQIALEQRIAKNITLQYDLGPVISKSVQHLAFHNQRGYKVKLQGRYYINTRTKNWAFYFGPEIYYNHVNYEKSETYRVHPSGYYQYLTYDMQYRERGITLKTGALFRVKRFCIDFQVGLAGRIVDNIAIGEPQLPTYQRVEPNPHFLESPAPLKPEEGSNIQTIRPTACIRFGYILLK